MSSFLLLFSWDHVPNESVSVICHILLDLSIYGRIPKFLFRTPYVLYGKHLHISKSEQGVANLLCLQVRIMALHTSGRGVAVANIYYVYYYLMNRTK